MRSAASCFSRSCIARSRSSSRSRSATASARSASVSARVASAAASSSASSRSRSARRAAPASSCGSFREGDTLPLLERLSALVGRTLAGGDRLAVGRGSTRFGRSSSRPRIPVRSSFRCSSASSRSRAAIASARSRNECFSCSSSASPSVAGACRLLCELAGEPEELDAVEVRPRVVAGLWPGRAPARASSGRSLLPSCPCRHSLHDPPGGWSRPGCAPILEG